MKQSNVIIAGAGGRDFHNFLVFFKSNPLYNVVCFTAAQIPGIAGRVFPAKLAGKKYPKGVPIFDEGMLPELVKKFSVDLVVFSYSDVSHGYVMHFASKCLSLGTDFWFLGPKATMLSCKKPVVSVCAVRTGSGKSQTSRYIALALKNAGKRVVVVRHPMPYGNLEKQAVERFSRLSDLGKYKCTIEEREEYEQYLRNGIVVFAGVDYKKILEEAEKEADVVLWDGGNNDFSFFAPSLQIVVLDPHRAGHELLFHPGEANFRMADIFVLNKMDTAKTSDVERVLANIKAVNPKAVVIKANSKIIVSSPENLRGRKALVVEDGPTLTHGGMKFGAGLIAAKRLGVKIVDAEKHAVGSIKTVYKNYRHLKRVLPAMGYSKKQVRELQETINRSGCEIVLSATPIDLASIIKTKKQIVSVKYELEEIGRKVLLKKVLEAIE